MTVAGENVKNVSFPEALKTRVEFVFFLWDGRFLKSHFFSLDFKKSVKKKKV